MLYDMVVYGTIFPHDMTYHAMPINMKNVQTKINIVQW